MNLSDPGVAQFHFGADFVLTASKLFPKLGFGRPVIVSGGLRASDAAWGGYVGFQENYQVTLEGNVVWLVHDRIGLAAEYRQYPDPYKRITVGGSKLLRGEDDWFTAVAGYVVNDHLTIAGGWGHFDRCSQLVKCRRWRRQTAFSVAATC